MKSIIKQLGNHPYKAQLTPFIILSTISLFIWFGGPFIAVAEYTPLEQSDKRFYAIMALFLAWFLKILFVDEKKEKAKPVALKPVASRHPDFTKKLGHLTGRFYGATDFLKKTIINKHGKDMSLHYLPWFLLIGPSGAGKTSLLANASINYILSKQIKTDNPQNTLPSEVCDWWVTRDSVLIDVPGFYLQSNQKHAANAPNATKQKVAIHHMLWNSFLELISRHRGKRALNGVVIALALPDLMNQQNQAKETLLYDLKNRISELRTKFGEQLPFYITLTKCDQLPGFTEFFSDSGSDEISQAWGVPLPKLNENEQLVEVFANRFDALIKRLNKQLIWRLHHERNPFTRPYIKDFPLQIERLKENVASLLKMLTQSEKNLCVHGVYLSSALQIAPEESTTTIHAAPSSQTALQIMRNPVMPSRAYFVKQLLVQGILCGGESTTVTPLRKHNPTAIMLSLGAILFVGLLFGNDFKQSFNQIFAIRSSLAEYQAEVNAHGVHLEKALPLLNALQQSSQKSAHSILFYSDKAQQSAYTAYQQALHTIVIPEIKSDLEGFLQLPGKTAEQHYAALKAYLMLGDNQHMQSDFILQQEKIIAPTLFAGANSDQVSSHMNIALNSSWHPIELDQEIIAQSRKHLFNLSPAELSFVILKNLTANNKATAINLGTDLGKVSALTNNENANFIPAMYTADNFQTIYDQQIDSAATEASQGNWVLGNISTLNQLNNTPLVEQLRSLYVIDYINAWDKAISSIQLAPHANLAQTDAIITELASQNAPLLELLNTVKQNTAFTPILTVSPKLAALDAFSGDTNSQSNLSNVVTTLGHLHTYLQNILRSNDVNHAAFVAASDRMKAGAQANDPLTQLFALAQVSPEPIKSWLNDIAQHSWHYILTDASQYVEYRWNSEVMAPYSVKMSNSSSSLININQNVEVDQIIKVLGTKSTVTSFYQNYLQPFVENTGKGWQWKTLNNERIPFGMVVISQVEHAVQFQTAMLQKTASKMSNGQEILLNYNNSSHKRKYLLSNQNLINSLASNMGQHKLPDHLYETQG